MTRFGLLPLFVLLPACGAEIEPSPENSPPPAPGDPRVVQPGKSQSGETNEGEEETSAVAPLVRVKNTSSTARFIVVDSQSTPVDFKIGEPPLQLNAYGSYWCDGPKDLHNDPFARVERIEPGEFGQLYWRAISVTREGDCWKGTPLPPGTYAIQACSYSSMPDGQIRVPGDKAATTPLECPIATLVIPATGEAVVEL